MPRPNEYRMIEAWGLRVMRSDRDYVELEQEQAAEENAPLNAIFQNDDGTWSTYDDCKSTNWLIASGWEARKLMDNYIEEQDNAPTISEWRKKL